MPLINATSACHAANERSRSEHKDFVARKYITKTILCDVQPFCAAETLFSHEFFWPQKQLRRGNKRRESPSPSAVSRCRSWKDDADWPVTEPHLSRATLVPRPRSFWDVMKLLPNRTVWLHGDSITLQMCDAALCSLMRSGVVDAPALLPQKFKPMWLRTLEADTKYNFIAAPLLPNGARFMCSGIGVFQRAPVEKILTHVDVAALNFGLHYNDDKKFEPMLRDALTTLSAWRMGSPHSRVALWREGSAQHFKGTGSYTRGAEKTAAHGAPCECAPLGTDVPYGNNLNVLGWRHERRLAPVHGVGLIPFFNLTAPRHNMHRRHYCAFDRQTKPGRCCDCTHFCFTPLFWDAVFGGMHRAARRAIGGPLRVWRPGGAALKLSQGRTAGMNGGGRAAAAASRKAGRNAGAATADEVDSTPRPVRRRSAGPNSKKLAVATGRGPGSRKRATLPASPASAAASKTPPKKQKQPSWLVRLAGGAKVSDAS